ncbi:MAG: cytochrome c [Pseudomonadota bacterium]
MKPVHALTLAALVASTSAFAAGDPVAGERKAAACAACHGSASFPGMFPLVQLAGRDADKLTIKTNKYRTGKLFSPLMNLAVMGASDQDVEDISAYYQKLAKPFMPMPGIRGDEDYQASLK